MRKSIRCALIAGVVGGALAVAGPALAAFSPKIIVKPNPTGGTNIRVAVNQTDDATARFVLYAPLGTSISAPLAPGTALGTVTAHASAADLGGAVLPLTGNVLVANPADPTIILTSTACDNVPHVTTLVLNLQAAGQVLNIPIFVDQPTGLEATFAGLKFTICLAPPDVPIGTPGRATFGAKFLDADFNISAVTGPTAAGQHRWRSLWTPYTPLVGMPNAQGTVETQSIVFLPTTLTLQTKAKSVFKKVKGKRVYVRTVVTITGTLSAGGQPAPSQPVTINAGATAAGLKKLSTVATKADGTFSLSTAIKKTAVFQATVTSPDRDLGRSECTPTFAAQGIACIQATVAGGSLTSSTVKVVPKKK
jgi:hypothetical protein